MSAETASSTVSKSKFWQAVSILTRNYHGVNRKLSGVKLLNIYKVTKGRFNVNSFQIPNDVNDIPEALINSDVEVEAYPAENIDKLFSSDGATKREQCIIISKVFYKQNRLPANYIFQVADFLESSFHCHPILPTTDSKLSFDISLRSDKLHIQSSSNSDINADPLTQNWLEYVLRTRLTKWAHSTNVNEKSTSVKSLTLVDIEEYTRLYTILKEKYGKDMVERWTESTDPLKFVYEDVAIATYLITLWKTDGNPPKNFIDMGCGNGLLVNILNSEGYNGCGVDVRKRKIWDIFPKTTKLEERTIIPTDYNAYKDFDWIIGNHSDELSPWIPVIAAMASYDTKFFLLPCCAYEFSGRKFQRRICNESVYNDFLKYVQEVSNRCGFETKVDRLKIPSTKRVAIIGSQKSYPVNQYDIVYKEIEAFINSELQAHSFNVKLREKEELVRNCTKIDRQIINRIVMKIFELILAENDCTVDCMEKWRTGRSISLGEIASELSTDDLKSIKSECGGLKTLIKNKHDVFEVLGDRVKLRKPIRKEKQKGFQYKRRPCFFFHNHPDRCPLDSSVCTFVHEEIKV